MNNFIGISFENKTKIYNFLTDDSNLIIGDYVLVETAKGKQIGIVKKEPFKVSDEKLSENVKSVIRKATDKDLKQHEKNKKESKEALKKCKEIVERRNMKMLITKAEYTFEKDKLIFSFLADNRVDFRELVKELASIFHTRIELIQIGVRDKAKEVGGIGPCGQILCCHRYKSNFDNISINMAKNQNIALNPNKINGQCGRLLCCLKYEDDCYKECQKKVPKVGSNYETKQGKGRVISVDVLNSKFVVNVQGVGNIEVQNDTCCK